MFLQRIAKAFYTAYEADIRKFTFVFPNRRAGLFFQKYLTELIDKPVFSPEIITINDCFFNASTRRVADRTAELFRLYRIYRQVSKSEETFDAFVFWGEMLLTDFNDVDKYRADPRQIFTNVKELKEIDQLSEYISDDQKAAIEQFWKHFLPKIESKTKKEFIAIWRILLPLYEEFCNELRNENLATEGMIFREVVDKLRQNDDPEYFRDKKFVFVGFNALNKSEQMLFEELRKRHQADFYWDYESDELRDEDNQASGFYRENIRNFPSALTIDPEVLPLSGKSFELIAVPSSVGQTKEVFNLLNLLFPEDSPENDLIKTAVVLPDESLLVPLLHSLPETVEKVNVTMGFPLKATPVSGLLENLFELQRRMNARGQFYHITVSNILNHQYINMLCGEQIRIIHQEMVANNSFYVDESLFANDELLKTIFTSKKDPAEFMTYLLDVLKKLNVAWQRFAGESEKYSLECDFLYQYYTALNRLNDVMKSIGRFEMGIDTLVRLIRQLVGGISIPFEGEPLNGLQVMGMLETRGLDFENLIICSFNEGVFPKKSTSSSFIPATLRRAFGLPVSEYHDAISAYNFYRLIQRTRRIFFLYDSRSEGMQTGEVSRYIHQLRYHYNVDIKQVNVTYEINSADENIVQVSKTPEIMEKLALYLTSGENERALSASSLNTYIQCPLQFFLKYVEQMEELEEVQESVESGMFGTLLHEVMEKLYEPFVGKMVQKQELTELSKNNLLIDKTITRAFATRFFKKKNEAADLVELEGNYLLTARVIHQFVEKILLTDASRAPFRYIQSEKNILIRYPFENGTLHVNLKGYIDRVDEKDGMTRILDYKTGGDELKFNSVGELFERNNKKRPKAVFQTFLYCLLYNQKAGTENLVPEVLKVRDLFKSNFTTQLYDKVKDQYVEDFNVYRDEFSEKLTELIREIFDAEVPFEQCTELELCRYCTFRAICRREVKTLNY